MVQLLLRRRAAHSDADRSRERDERAGLAAERPPRLDDGHGGWGDGGEAERAEV